MVAHIKATIIEIKDPDVVDGMLKRRFHVMLRRFVRWIHKTYRNVTWTEFYRPQLHPDDLHGTNPVRAGDMRSWSYPDSQAMADQMNEVWEYDYTRPDMKCCVFHARCPECLCINEPPEHQFCVQCGEEIAYHWHFHLQVHDNTRRRDIDNTA